MSMVPLRNPLFLWECDQYIDANSPHYQLPWSSFHSTVGRLLLSVHWTDILWKPLRTKALMASWFRVKFNSIHHNIYLYTLQNFICMLYSVSAEKSVFFWFLVAWYFKEVNFSSECFFQMNFGRRKVFKMTAFVMGFSLRLLESLLIELSFLCLPGLIGSKVFEDGKIGSSVQQDWGDAASALTLWGCAKSIHWIRCVLKWL